MRIIILNIVFVLFVFSCQGANKKLIDQRYLDTDSIKIVANYFLTYDIFINSFVVSDRDVEEIYQYHQAWIKKFFPAIIKNYDLTLYSQFTLAIYLYLKNDKEHLKKLWYKYERLVKNKEFKSILNLLKYYKISLK